MPARITVLDTTLRDGEQTPGIALTPDKKLEIAMALDELGVDVIEAGSAATSDGERKAIKMIVKEGPEAEICSFVRALREDVDAALRCEVDSVHLVVPVSETHMRYKLRKNRSQVKKMAFDAMQHALDHGLKVELSAEDASRADPSFLREFLLEGVKGGAHRVCLCDTVGVLTPERSKSLFSEFSKLVKVPLAVHCHDDFGMATANTLQAVLGGAREVHVTVNGLGERGGNAALEEVVLALSHLHELRTGIRLKKLYQTSKLVERLTGIPLPPNKAVVGENAFTHGAGIHAHGVLAHPSTYEPISPEAVGHHRKLVFGKHAGIHAIESELKRLGLKPTKPQLKEIVSQVKRLGDQGKLVTDAELGAIANEVMGRRPEDVVRLMELTVISGNRVTPTSSVKVKFGDREITESGVGVGPVDAAMNAIRKIVEDMAHIRLVEYHVDAISGGTDALVSVIVKLTDGRSIVTARGTSGDIIMASVQALLNGVNHLLGRKR
ncbi:MAG: 2-isopropylmalate synthase [Candidatus Hadarchaeales archaeon]